MILTYKECINRFGSDYMIKKEIGAGRLYQKDKGIYSDQKNCSELEIITVKYPRGCNYSRKCLLLLWTNRCYS